VWELAAGEAAFAGMAAARVLFLVVGKNYRPPIPERCPEAYANLMSACWHSDPEQRWVSTLKP
jgi:Protein tyrosine and serine/threonine kinase